VTKFLNLASKVLAVIGVLTLMYAGSGIQKSKADYPAGTPLRCYAVTAATCSGPPDIFCPIGENCRRGTSRCSDPGGWCCCY
jgi:hypothetical protein